MPESKVNLLLFLILAAVLVVLFGLYQFFVSDRDSSSFDEETVEDIDGISYPAITPEEVGTAFFDWYLTPENKLPENAYQEAESLTTEFKSQVERIYEEGGVDPISCDNEIPADFTVRPGEIEDRVATSIVDMDFEEEGISFIVEFTLSDNSWKINNVICFIKG